MDIMLRFATANFFPSTAFGQHKYFTQNSSDGQKFTKRLLTSSLTHYFQLDQYCK